MERSFAQHHQAFETEIMAGPNLHWVNPVWPVPGRRAIEPHLATLTAWDPDTSWASRHGSSTPRRTRAARRVAPALADHDVQPGARDSAKRPGFVVRHVNLIVAGSSSRWPGVQKALADLR